GCRAHEVAVAFAGGGAAFVDGPDDEALAAAAIAGGEDAGEVGRVDVVVGLDVAARVGVEGERLEQGLLGSEEAHGQQHELRGAGLFGAGLFDGDELALVVFLPLDLDGDERLDATGGVGVEFFDGGQVNARVGALAGGGFFLAVVHFEGLGPFGPGVVGGALGRGLGQDFDLGDGAAALAQGGADAVGAGIAAADDDDVAVFGVDRAGGGRAGEQGLGGGGEEVHGEVHAGVGAAFDGEVAGLGGAGADDDGVVVAAELRGVVGDADVGVADEGDAFLLHDLYPAKDYVFFVQFHVGDAIHEEAAGAVGAFEDGDGVAGGVELGGG